MVPIRSGLQAGPGGSSYFGIADDLGDPGHGGEGCGPACGAASMICALGAGELADSRLALRTAEGDGAGVDHDSTFDTCGGGEFFIALFHRRSGGKIEGGEDWRGGVHSAARKAGVSGAEDMGGGAGQPDAIVTPIDMQRTAVGFDGDRAPGEAAQVGGNHGGAGAGAAGEGDARATLHTRIRRWSAMRWANSTLRTEQGVVSEGGPWVARSTVSSVTKNTHAGCSCPRDRSPGAAAGIDGATADFRPPRCGWPMLMETRPSGRRRRAGATLGNRPQRVAPSSCISNRRRSGWRMPQVPARLPRNRVIQSEIGGLIANLCQLIKAGTAMAVAQSLCQFGGDDGIASA